MCKQPVTITVLGSKYSEIYSQGANENMLKRCTTHKYLKQFLGNQTDYFEIDKDNNVVLINKQHTEKNYSDLDISTDDAIMQPISSTAFVNKINQLSSTSDTALQPMSPHKSIMNSTPSNNEADQSSDLDLPHCKIAVYFLYGKEKFPKIITCADIESFKNQVLEELSSRLPEFKPVQVEYTFGKETYPLEVAHSFEELLMNDNMEVEINAIPEHCNSDSSPNLDTSMQNSLSVNTKHSNDSKTSSKTYDSAEDIHEENDLQKVINSCFNFLKRSLAILLISVMTKVYGTDKWLDQLKKAFPRDDKKAPNKKINNISDSDIWSLPPDMLLKLIIRADEWQSIFSKLPACDCDFKALAESVLGIRHLYAHMKSYREAALRFDVDYLNIKTMSQEIVKWVETNGTPENVDIVNEDLQHIKLCYSGHKSKVADQIDAVITSLARLNFNDYGYVLYSVIPHNFSTANPTLEHLSAIPWHAVIDFDPHSKQNGGLLSCMCEHDDTNYWMKPKCINFILYSDLDQIDKSEFVKPSHMPWIFPHGDDKSNISNRNPMDPEDKYTSRVQKPVFDAIQDISRSILKQKLGMISLILCYGDFACSSSTLPYENFLDDFFVELCSHLKLQSKKVVVLTDSTEVKVLLSKKHEIKVFNIPLDFFCQTISNTLTKKHMPPKIIPHLHGLQEIINFVEEDFTLVHEKIAEHEMLDAMFQRQTKSRQSKDDSQNVAAPTEFDERHEIIQDFGERFYKCETISFVSLANDHAITRKEESVISKYLKDLLLERIDRKTEPAKYVLYHTIGAGATTLARKIIYQLRCDYPCAILKPNYNDKKTKDTSQALKKLHMIVKMPILMLIDEEPTVQTVSQLTNRVQIDGIPMVFLHVQRFVNDEHVDIEMDSTDNFYLPSQLSKTDGYNFQEKLCTVFDKGKISAGDKRINEIKASMVTPREEDEVQDTLEGKSPRYGTIFRICRHSDYYEAEIKWDNSVEWCTIGTSTTAKRRVFLTNINDKTHLLFQTFHIYGVMCLGEEFRKPMKEYIKTRLNSIPSTQEELRILAHLSLLFAFQVSDVTVVHSRSFQQLCYKIKPDISRRDFDLRDFIPESAKEFALVDPLGWFCVIHSIVANEILKFILTKIEVPLSELVCEFLQCMLSDSEYPNKDVESAITSLLIKREHYSAKKKKSSNMILAVEEKEREDGAIKREHYSAKKKKFSNMILAVEEKEREDGAIKVFQCALPLINNYHSYCHLARYLSKRAKRVEDFSQALQYITRAKELVYQDFEMAIVQNIEGDIYRDKLDHYIQNKIPCWSKPNDIGYVYHKHACDAYQNSYRSNHMDFPLNGEIKAWLSLMQSVKKNYLHENPKSDFTILALNSPQVSESVVRCLELFKKLDEFIMCGDGGKADSSSNHKASAASLKAQFYVIIESTNEKQKEILRKFIDDNDVKSESKVHCRRWYARLFIHGQMPKHKRNPSDISCRDPHQLLQLYNYLLKILEENIRIIGYNNKDMELWLLVVRKLPIDMEIIEQKLLEWKKSKTCDSIMLVNFYLSILYFITLCESEGNVSLKIAEKLETANKIVQEKGKQNTI